MMDATEIFRTKAEAEALLPRFQFERLLNQDQAGRRLSLLGTLDSQPTILLAERAAFATDPAHLSAFAQSLNSIQNLGANDIYSWFLVSSASNGATSQSQQAQAQPPDLKLNLIHPCTPAHIAKYSAQGVRLVTETPAIYRTHVAPYIERKRAGGRLNWVYNILDGRTEQEDVILRVPSSTNTSADPAAALETPSAKAAASEDGFLLLPDLNWDRKTLTSMHLLAVASRRDIRSVRDLTPAHIPWLKRMRAGILDAVASLYPGGADAAAAGRVEKDQVKLYVHYQPTYYHFHVHVVHVLAEVGVTQGVGKALGLEGIVASLEGMRGGGMADLEMSYVLGEASELWLEVFEPLKRGVLSETG